MMKRRYLWQRKMLSLLLVMLFAIGSSTVPAYAVSDDLGEQWEVGEQTNETVSQQRESETESVVESETPAVLPDAPTELVTRETETEDAEESTDVSAEQITEPATEVEISDLLSDTIAETDAEQEELLPVWSLEYPSSLPVACGTNVLTLDTAKAINIENLGEDTIYLTISCDCVLSGESDEMPVMLYVDGVLVNPGEAAVYGTVTESGAWYAKVTLVFSDEGWNALSSGSYSMEISYHSYVE